MSATPATGRDIFSRFYDPLTRLLGSIQSARHCGYANRCGNTTVCPGIETVPLSTRFAGFLSRASPLARSATELCEALRPPRGS